MQDMETRPLLILTLSGSSRGLNIYAAGLARCVFLCL